ncbi:hypothetical protein [Anditalea andensis]|uniref:Rad50/SbcC-type AAA domain-containing protein n=1 Tax=Anditalea andensis TaxID=1048983 RepID=A0A074KQM7_9BACT|nr:hypothetical protein [Anditalea andensis]KEO72246.1 hypothetical protein EL17_18775 [Anditalea andensis]
MIIKKVAIGNQYEAFIEDRLQNRTNIIFSDDNNKGKTILMQSIVFSIGYDSIWPVGFEPKNYYFYSKISFNEIDYEFLRHRNSLLILGNNQTYIFNSISEFKYFISKELIEIPKIPKDGQLKISDLSLFYELFFLGQDKRNTSNIIVKANHNKVDFLNMLFSLQGISSIQFDEGLDVEELKKKKVELEEKIKIERKKIQILKKNPQIATYVSNLANNEDFEKTKIKLKDLHNSISEFKKQRNREENRRTKLFYLLRELNSLNRNLKEGKVKCANCKSSNIVFSNEDFEFDVSNKFIRDNIISSIKENIKLKDEIIEEYNNLISKEQTEINKVLETPIPDFSNYVLFESEIRNSTAIDDSVSRLINELNEVNNKINLINNGIELNKEKQSEFEEGIVAELARLYKAVDSNGTMTIKGLFTKSNETFSGSEEQEFYFCKIVALNNILKHNFPIIIDSFREGELSTTKEEKMIEEFVKLNKQVILTSTLKREEYSADKYSVFTNVNPLDYSQFQDSKLLQPTYVEEFKKVIQNFPITI